MEVRDRRLKRPFGADLGVVQVRPRPLPCGVLTCPVCHDPLDFEGRAWRCPAGHAFDRAREGYVDLLPVGHGRSGITGDTREMARARQRFLDAGHYAPLVDALVRRVGAHLASPGDEARPTSDRPSAVIAETGCGTGHYIGAIGRAVPDATLFGVDVSREACRIAARAHPRATFAINDVTHRLTLADASVDVLLDVFAPRNPAEFRRVLKPDGLLAVVIPEDEHLAELRARHPMLDIAPGKRARTMEQLAPSFELAGEEPIEWAMDLDAGAVQDLIGMGPSAFHSEPEAAGAARVTARVRLLAFRPRARRNPTVHRDVVSHH